MATGPRFTGRVDHRRRVNAFRDGRVVVDAESAPLAAEILLHAVAAAGTIAPAVDGRIRILPPR